jgi:hypothetical protein
MKINELANLLLKLFYDCAEEGGYNESYILHLDKIIEETGEKDVSKILNACDYLCDLKLINTTLCEIRSGIVLPLTRPCDAQGIIAIDGQITKNGALYIEEHSIDKDKKMTIINLAFEILQILYDRHFGEAQLHDNRLSDKEITQRSGEINKKKMLAATKFLENNNYIIITPKNILGMYDFNLQILQELPAFNFKGTITEKGMMAVESGNLFNEPLIQVDRSRHTVILGDGNIVQSSVGDITIINQEVTEIFREIEGSILNDNTLTQDVIKDALNDLKSLILQLDKKKKDTSIVERILTNLGSIASIASLVAALQALLT